jgi:hypothetical protein
MLPTRIRHAPTIHGACALTTSLTLLVRLSHVLADAGRSVDFNGLDDGIGRLYAKILDLDPEAARELEPKVLQLATEINLLLGAHGAMIPSSVQLRIRSCVTATRDDGGFGPVVPFIRDSL